MASTRLVIALSSAIGILGLGGCDEAAPPAGPSRPAVPSAAAAPRSASTALTEDSLRALLAEQDDFATARQLGELLPTRGPESVPAVKQVLRQAALLEMNAIEYELLMHYWTTHEPEEAAAHALGKAPRAYRVAAIHGAVTPWVKRDPEKALATMQPYLAARRDPGGAAQMALVRGWYASGRPGLEDYLRGMSAGVERQSALSALATSIIRDKGAEGLVSWMESIPDSAPDYRLEALLETGTTLVSYDVRAARRFCDAHCKGPSGGGLRTRIADRWARDDAAAALTWLAEAPADQETHSAVSVTYAVWASRDSAGAIRWMKERIERHASGETPRWLELTLPIYARLLAADSPGEGLAVAARLKDPHERTAVLIELAHAWYHERDSAAAEAWLRGSPLDEASRAIVRSPERPVIESRERESDGAQS